MAEILEWAAASDQRQVQIVAAAKARHARRQQPWVSP
jgi:predicted Fe-S protein YdhL (DUF1289 family)